MLIIALVNTTISSLLIFGSLFLFSFGRGFRSSVGVEELLLISVAPILILGIICSWVAVLKPLQSLSVIQWLIIFTSVLFVSWLCLLAALST